MSTWGESPTSDAATAYRLAYSSAQRFIVASASASGVSAVTDSSPAFMAIPSKTQPARHCPPARLTRTKASTSWSRFPDADFTRPINCPQISESNSRSELKSDGGSATGKPRFLAASSNAALQAPASSRPEPAPGRVTSVLDPRSSAAIQASVSGLLAPHTGASIAASARFTPTAPKDMLRTLCPDSPRAT